MDEHIFKKLVEDFKKVQLNIRKMKDAGLYVESLVVINDICLRSFDFDIAVPKGIPDEDLIIFLVEHRQLNIFQINILAELLMLEGEVHFQAKKYLQSKLSYEKALRIFLVLDKEEPPVEPTFNVLDNLIINMEMIKKIKAELNKNS